MALVTGANRGIGAEIVRQLADDHGFVVYAAARDPDDVEEAAGILPIELDVTEEDEIFAATERVGSEVGDLDYRAEVVERCAEPGHRIEFFVRRVRFCLSMR